MAATIPDVNERTRLLAILGNTDPDPFDGDGWMYSDFCLLNQLLRDQGAEQVWLHATDFDAAVHKFGPILHGQPHRKRKTVYSLGMTLGHLRHCSITQLKRTFLEELARMGADSVPGDRILIILVGHGNQQPFGLCISDVQDGDPEFESHYLLTRSDVDGILGRLNPMISQCIISNSCFSGAWLCSSGNRSSMVAVSDEGTSGSFDQSASGGCRGGYFTAALADTLRAHQASEESYLSHTENIMTSLDSLWAFLLAQNPSKFSAQNDAWNDSVASKTGLAQVEYQQRFDALLEVPADPVESETDRQQGARRSRYVRTLIREYRLLKPGRNTMASNVAIEGRIGLFEGGNQGGRKITPHEMGWLAIALKHRLKVAFCASAIVYEMRLTPFPCFSSWSYEDWPHRKTWGEHAYRNTSEVLYRFGVLLPRFPKRTISGYRLFMKPIQYVICASLAKGLDQFELHRRLALFQHHVFPAMELPSDVY